MHYKISVIVPVFNSEKTIVSCLNSILNQTIRHIEIICVNDGSIDQSLTILEEYKRNISKTFDGEMVIVNQQNSGPSAARNRGIDEAHGEYIAFVDSDDTIDPQMYQVLINIAEINNLNVVLCNIIDQYPDGKEKINDYKIRTNTVLYRNDILNLICPNLMEEGIFGGPCNRIYKREFIVKNNIRMPENLGYGEDCMFQMQVFDNLNSTFIDSRALYHYIHRTEGQSFAKPGRFKNTLEILYENRCRYAKKWNIDQVIIDNYFIYCSIMDLVITIKSKSYKRKISYLKYFLHNRNLKKALSNSQITKNQYTLKIYAVYIFLKVLTLSI